MEVSQNARFRKREWCVILDFATPADDEVAFGNNLRRGLEPLTNNFKGRPVNTCAIDGETQRMLFASFEFGDVGARKFGFAN